MKILQIACGVSYTKVYYELFSSLKNGNISFEVYIPQHKGSTVTEISKNEFPFSFYSNKIIKPLDKFIYYTKIKRMTKDVQQNFTLSDITLIHSHSLFSDGGVAYEIYKMYSIPYIVAIRDTDVNQYFRKGIHLRRYALNILMNARYIIFLSEAYKNMVMKKYIPKRLHDELIKKVRIVPNGINKYWLDNKERGNSIVSEGRIKLLFVGQIIKRKNVLKIIEATKVLEKKYNEKIELLLVGEKLDEKYFKELSRNGDFKHIPYLDKETLMSYYREADVFVMPSLTETFGLVYAEAMSQGLPIIYTKGQGFDRQFNDGEVGYSVDPHNEFDIAKKIDKVIKNKEIISKKCIDYSDKFNWNVIGQTYKDIYQNAVTHK